MRKEKTVDFHIKWAWHSISKMYNGFAARFDMTMATSYVLLNIDMEKGTPATKIGPSLGMEPRSMVRMLKTMEEKGLIYREVDDHDKRFVRIVLTPKGKEKRELARDGVIGFNNLIRQKVPLEKLVIFFDVMQSIKAIVEEESQKLKSESTGNQDLADQGE
ncbi:MAG: MarR family transcriptional regulator [Cytophagaceae bacterium SCN 52-12]|nr:MAG: MarR family transcriptional regulator [Cytophagaceae bacterium SCN 52-12]